VIDLSTQKLHRGLRQETPSQSREEGFESVDLSLESIQVKQKQDVDNLNAYSDQESGNNQRQ